MKLINIPDGAYDKDLNEVEFSFCMPEYQGGVKYIVHKGQKFEFSRSSHDGTITLTDVTWAGNMRGKLTTLTIQGVFKETLQLCNDLSAEYKSNIQNFVTAYNELVNSVSGDYEKMDIIVNGNTYRATVTSGGAGTYFSILGDYPPLKERPKRWTASLVMRGLANYQLQQSSSYKFDDMSGERSSRDSTDLKYNAQLASDLGRASFNWEGNNVNTTNYIGVYFHSNSFMTLEIIDPKLRV